MRLTDLHPKFLGGGGEGVTKDDVPVPERHGVALSFDCPCGCDSPCCIHFANPLDGGPPYSGHTWKRTGDTFENLVLSPSIRRVGGCAWHGFIGGSDGSKPGEVVQV